MNAYLYYLYRLIIHSKLPSAEKFEHWVFEEVLPCIRKTGGYMSDNLINELMNEPDIIYKITSDMLKERGQRMRLESEAKAAKPKVEYSGCHCGREKASCQNQISLGKRGSGIQSSAYH